MRTFDDIKIGCTIIQDKNDIYSVTREFYEKWVMSRRPNDSTMIGYGKKAGPHGSNRICLAILIANCRKDYQVLMDHNELWWIDSIKVSSNKYILQSIKVD